MNTSECLPTSLPRHKKENHKLSGNGMVWLKIFCANCGTDGGSILENDYDFAFYLCDPCAVKYGEIAGTYSEPDAVFWEKLKHAQIEKYGRELAPNEFSEELKDGHSIISKLSKDYR